MNPIFSGPLGFRLPALQPPNAHSTFVNSAPVERESLGEREDTSQQRKPPDNVRRRQSVDAGSQTPGSSPHLRLISVPQLALFVLGLLKLTIEEARLDVFVVLVFAAFVLADFPF